MAEAEQRYDFPARPLATEKVDPDARAPIVRRYLSLAPRPRAFTPVDREAPLEAFQTVTAGIPVFRVRSDREAHRTSAITAEEITR
jgi:hypothetical protein